MDVLTDTQAIELDWLKGNKFHEDIGQALHYGDVTGQWTRARIRRLQSCVPDPLAVCFRSLKSDFLSVNDQPSMETLVGYALVFYKFGDWPMTFNRGSVAKKSVELEDGDLTTGGHVKGRFFGTDDFTLKEIKRAYEWNLKVDVDVN